ncbi:PilW family protein [Pyxidicoccus sp. MSG2]|uniref:PilW family protein n=1 Tax=Pyxidicoccus sp. MSG2 TaxID=2996790 RepID=UPI00226F99FC|nr:PilW family protein [Pyxidicoccus sp. MSG2]MCY1023785.1 PilW family protein [Pyxidicoccus sp. MSG2]
MRRWHARGFSLIELIVAMAVMLVAIAAVSYLLIATLRMKHNTENAIESNDAARLALEPLVKDLRLAGMGASGGLWLNQGGIPTQVNAVFGLDGAAAATTFERDDLWLVLPDPQALRESCVDRGASTSVVSAGVGALSVTCTTSLRDTDLLMVSNMTSAALLTGLTLTPAQQTTPGSIDYAESTLSGFSNAPGRGGFQVGDFVFPVTLVHYYIDVDPASSRPALYRAQGRLAPDARGRPFSDVAGSERMVQLDIEDLQVAYGFDAVGSGRPEGYAFQHGLGPAWLPGMRSLRVSIVGRGPQVQRDARDVVVSGLRPVSIENHDPAGAPEDGFRRSQYTRRVELPNMAAGVL